MNETFFLTIISAAFVTLILKGSFIEGSKYIQLPQWFREALEFAPPAGLCALVVPGIFKGEIGLIKEFGMVAIDPRWIAAVVAISLFLKYKRTIDTLALGMVVLHASYWGQLATQ